MIRGKAMNVVIISCFDICEERVRLLHRFFKQKNDKVSILTSNFRHFQKVVREEAPEDFILLETSPYRRNLSLKRGFSHQGFARAAVKEADRLEPDFIYALVPPNSLVKELAEYKKKHPQVKLVFDLMDLWPETMPISILKKNPIFHIWGKLRNDNLNAADYVITECHLFYQRLEDILKNKLSKTIYLAHENRKVLIEDNTPKDAVALCYLGSINHVVDIRAIGRLIRQISKDKPVKLHIIGGGEKKDKLIKTAQKNGAFVCYYGKVYDPGEKQKILNQCHYGLNIMKPSVCVGLTMKSIDYFQGGLPIINNISGDTWELVQTEGIGINYRTGEKLLLPETDKKYIYEFYLKHFSEEVFYAKLQEVYECLV